MNVFPIGYFIFASADAVYSDASQLNSTRRRVELSCVAINGPLDCNTPAHIVRKVGNYQHCRLYAWVFNCSALGKGKVQHLRKLLWGFLS